MLLKIVINQPLESGDRAWLLVSEYEMLKRVSTIEIGFIS